MKGLEVIFVSLLTLAIGIISVESTSMPYCGRCDRRMCYYQGCRCGYFMDYCNCCPVCYKCPGERCNIGMDRCTRGSRCIGPQDTSIFTAYQYGGQCL